MSRRPSSTCLSMASEAPPTLAAKNRLSRVTICDTLTTDCLLKPVPRIGKGTLPGAAANFRFDVMAKARTV